MIKRLSILALILSAVVATQFSLGSSTSGTKGHGPAFDSDRFSDAQVPALDFGTAVAASRWSVPES
ncbi:MAG: hypothetical protein CBC49_000810 [Alphaproteobacteria bacterium TMED89]|nr:hypothetical protein [Rhodospirillaceae bacterium]RPH19942.1 MAG: hypothetical protein CBC49_000810 [Alphaproteobacteria bacterium TMED89]